MTLLPICRQGVISRTKQPVVSEQEIEGYSVGLESEPIISMSILSTNVKNNDTITTSTAIDTIADSSVINISIDQDIKPKIGFLSLPPEVRNDIYSYLYTSSVLGLSTIHPSGPLCRSFCKCAFPWSLSQTCRQLRAETTPLLLSRTTLEITTRIDKLSLLPDLYLASIPHLVVLDAKSLSNPTTFAKFPLNQCRKLKILELRNISVWCKYHDESYLESDEADEGMYELARFNLRRINPALLALCDRDFEERRFKVLLGCQFVGNSMRHETIQATIDVDTKQILQKSRGASIGSRNEWAGFY